MRVLIVIPARYAAQRFPGKPLADLNGKPMIQWVYEAAARVRSPEGHPVAAVVATDDERIARAVEGFGGRHVMTSHDLKSGTDRVAAVAAASEFQGYDVLVNVQGDEPLIESQSIAAGIELVTSGRFPMGTVMTRLRSRAELEDRNVVKVLASRSGQAIYFSRLPIPYGRQPNPDAAYLCFRHIGLYVYTRETVLRFSRLEPSPLEQAESLEQLRALDHGIPIGICEVRSVSIGVDTPQDLETVRKCLNVQSKA